MLAKLATLIAKELKKDTVTPPSTLVDFNTTAFTEQEIQLLKKLGEDKIFPKLIDKLIMKVVIGNLDIHNIEDLSRRNGGISALRGLLAETLLLQPKDKEIDYRTNEYIK